jgi:membrane protease subunit HflK
MYLETMQQIFTSTTKMMVDTKNGNNMIYLPLDKLIGQTLSTDVSTAQTKSVTIPGAQEVTNANELLRARDAHARDREGR